MSATHLRRPNRRVDLNLPHPHYSFPRRRENSALASLTWREVSDTSRQLGLTLRPRSGNPPGSSARLTPVDLHIVVRTTRQGLVPMRLLEAPLVFRCSTHSGCVPFVAGNPLGGNRFAAQAEVADWRHKETHLVIQEIPRGKETFLVRLRLWMSQRMVVALRPYALQDPLPRLRLREKLKVEQP